MSESVVARPSILVVDDDEPFRMVLVRALRARGYEARAGASYDEAVEQIRVDPPQFAVVDVRMPGRSGLELVDAIKRAHPATIVLVLTADRSPESMAIAKQHGASLYLNKPTDADEIVSALQTLVA